MADLCNDYGDCTGCLKYADPQYTMLFDDIGRTPILWCSFCGPEAHRFMKLIEDAFENDESFQDRFAKALDEAQQGVSKH